MKKPKTNSILLVIAACICTPGLTGCIQPPGGSPIETQVPLGTVLDEVNRLQEENAEASKFVIYEHEFEINVPLEFPEEEISRPGFRFRPEDRIRGYRLNERGQEHVASIAKELLTQQNQEQFQLPYWDVVVERSQSSKRWATRHRYPVHFNRELDEARRQTVVAALMALGINNADQIVVVAPAFAEGMDAQDSAHTYQRSRSNGSSGF